MNIDQFIKRQLEAWPMAKANYEALANVRTKRIALAGDYWAQAQFNPARIASTGAKVDKDALAKRPCFLCAANRPKVQFGIDWRGYEILVNPFPIFPEHLTIPAKQHTPQRIKGRFADMLDLAKELDRFTVFYNGPKCGASAPDHMHFQAVDGAMMPFVEPVLDFTDMGNFVVRDQDFLPGCIYLMGYEERELVDAFEYVYSVLDKLKPEGEDEPMMNVLCSYWFLGPYWQVWIIPRKKHRPDFYGPGEDQMLLSPASVDLGGLFITPVEKDFNRIDAQVIKDTISQVCYTPAEIIEMFRK